MIGVIIGLGSLLAISLVFNYILYLENKENTQRLKLVDQLQSNALYNKWSTTAKKKKAVSRKINTNSKTLQSN